MEGGIEHKDIENSEVSFVLLPQVNADPARSLKEIAEALNIHLDHQRDMIPFVPFNGFDLASSSGNVFLYARSGSGKSRAIFEIVKNRLHDFERIYL
ncbi:hypothetical protein, partial [Nitrososphaera sp.]|uniref:hypothetical protein n=1 Tax=Nitrososphaera sp. TaxID=1971748 RepID=UPI00307E3026